MGCCIILAMILGGVIACKKRIFAASNSVTKAQEWRLTSFEGKSDE